MSKIDRIEEQIEKLKAQKAEEIEKENIKMGSWFLNQTKLNSAAKGKEYARKLFELEKKYGIDDNKNESLNNNNHSNSF